MVNLGNQRGRSNTKEEPCTTCKVISKRTPLVNNSALCVQFIPVYVKCKKRWNKYSANIQSSERFQQVLESNSPLLHHLCTDDKHADVRQGQYVPVIYVLAPGASMSCMVVTHNALEPLRLRFSRKPCCFYSLFCSCLRLSLFLFLFPSGLFFCLFLSLSF